MQLGVAITMGGMTLAEFGQCARCKKMWCICPEEVRVESGVRDLALQVAPAGGSIPPPATSFDPAREYLKREGFEWCSSCGLCETRTQVVWPRGKPMQPYILVGEAPGEYEDEQGKAFVGKSGELLNKMLVAAGVDPETVYITNLVKCRPPDNRVPEKEEMGACAPKWLEVEINMLKVDFVICLGRTAMNYFHEEKRPSKLPFDLTWVSRYPFLVGFLYHPAYVLRGGMTQQAWVDAAINLFANIHDLIRRRKEK